MYIIKQSAQTFSMKRLIQIGSLVLCLTVLTTFLGACGKKTTNIGLAQVDVYAYVGNAITGPLTDTGTNKVTETNGTIRVDVASDVDDIEFDIAKFFNANTDYLGKDFYLTRDDVKKGDGTLVQGSAWVEVTGGTAATRLYKKLGYENDATVDAMTKQQIEGLPAGEGSVRMYILTAGTQAGKHVIYIDPTTASQVNTGETRVTFRFIGQNGKTAMMTVIVNKATV